MQQSRTAGDAEVVLSAERLTLSGRLRRADHGPARALLLCLHGGSYTSRYFRYESQAGATLFDLAPPLGYSVLAIDRPGYGLAHDRTMDFNEQATVLAKAAANAFTSHACTSMGIFIVGHSIGAMLAMLVAAASPAFPLLGLDLSGAGLCYRPTARRALQNYAALPDPPRAAVREARLARMFGDLGTYEHDVAEEDLVAAPLSQPSEIREALGWETRVTSIATQIRCPLRFCVAESDALWEAPASLSKQAHRMFSSAPYLEASIQRRAGHCIHLHKVGRAYNLRTLAFLDEVISSR